MTDDQKRRQRIELMLDLEKAEEDAKALRHALKTETDNLAAVGEWLEESVRSIRVDEPGTELYSRRLVRHVDIVKDPRFRESMNFERVIDLREQFIAAQKRHEELAARHRELKATA